MVEAALVALLVAAQTRVAARTKAEKTKVAKTKVAKARTKVVASLSKLVSKEKQTLTDIRRSAGTLTESNSVKRTMTPEVAPPTLAPTANTFATSCCRMATRAGAISTADRATRAQPRGSTDKLALPPCPRR